MQDVGVAPFDAFKMGIIYGYDTLDLLAGIFYAVSTWLLLNEQLKKHAEHMQKQLLFIFILSSLVAGACLTLIYAGLTFGAAAHLDALANAQPQRILAVLAEHLLGPKLGLVANIGIAIACMTTAMSLAVSIVDVIHMEIQDTWFARRFKWHYEWVLIGVILITVAFANLGFQKIMSFLHPIMEVCYPAIIMLTICNILYKMYGFEHVKVPVYLTAGLALVWQIYTLAF
jgi:LIVCS family branched-chain amino acid:cation transporter